jgi:hypothetical protein
MGVYDTIMAKCPECGAKNYFQTKSGDCILADYNIEDAPEDVMCDANRHTPQNCEGCDKLLVVDIENRKLASDGELKERNERIEAHQKLLEKLAKKSL